MSPLPLDLYAEVEAASGARYRWDANQPSGSRLANLNFTTKLGEGFSTCQAQLARRIDRDYPDLNLVDNVTFVGADGSVGWEGRMSAMPRELTDSHSISVSLAGWMAHMKDKKFREVYVDRDLGGWGPISVGRRSALLNANKTPADPSTAADPTDNETGVRTGWSGSWGATYLPTSEAWYDIGPGLTIGAVNYGWKRIGSTISPADTAWTWGIFAGADDKTTNEFTGDLEAAGPTALAAFTFPVPRQYAVLALSYTTGPAAADGLEFSISWNKLAVFGDHGVTVYTGEPNEPGGVRASDVIKNIAQRFCPMLNTDGVVDTTYVIQHLVFKDPTFPYDALIEINKYHLWHLGVWENRTLHFRPYDLTDYDWEIRTDDSGTTFSPQGPSVDDLFNGIVVTYTDVLTGKQNILTPDLYPELKDLSTDNPWNMHSVDHWNEITLSTPTLLAQALQIGRSALSAGNRPKAPGTITVQGYVRDRQGNRQPAWKVRAGDTISVTNFPNDAPRLIHETSYDDDKKTSTISVEAPASSLDAILDRQSVALTARGLT